MMLYPLWLQAMPECHRCGECCGLVLVSADEAALISAFCSTHDVSWKQRGLLTCGFLDDDNHCRIYEVRPLVCRLYGLIREMTCPYHPDAVLTTFPPDKALREVLGTTTVQLLAGLQEVPC